MSFNGSGIFERLYSFVNDAAANIKIRADRMDNELSGIATGLSTCITKDGQTTVTANLPMAGFRHTGVGNAAARTDYASFAQVQDGNTAWVDGGGTADAITAAYSIPITTLVDGQLCFVRATAANATTTPTFSPSSLTARTIVKNGGSALVAGDIAGDGHQLILRYDLANTRWELMNPATVSTAPFTDTTAIVKGSADATKLLRFEVDGFTTGTTRVLTPPNFDGTIATLAGTEAFSNKTLQDSTVTFVDNSDATKQLAFQCSGITTGTTRTLTVPDVSDTITTALTQRIVQTINAPVAGVATGTTTMPCDDTIPQITEGDQYNTVSITPTNASNKLLIEVSMLFSTSVTGGQFGCALFQDATANALSGIIQYMATSDRPLMFNFSYEMTAGTTSATTFRVRAGSESAGTTTLNGFGGNRKFGGVMGSSMRVTEIKV